MHFSLNALEIKEKKSILFSGKSSQAKKLIELMAKNHKNKENIFVVFDPANYSSSMEGSLIISNYSKESVNLNALPEISTKIHSVQGNKNSRGILLFDSISSMCSFNPVNAVYSFLFFETRKAKELNYSVVSFIDERMHEKEVLENIKNAMDYSFFFEFKEKKLFIEQTARPFSSVTKNFHFDL